ncbi:P-loop NTPase fold protein [Rhodoferax sp. OV413]|uniref:KAP family P-loop NTPase fold protein n=1 Tax=Rhodoferax sp. OV413 TaxID=1855285 RepID=UPI0015A0FEBD|nr:P-loop NTPase fold protein [Rhodoferax sp. OV413]
MNDGLGRRPLVEFLASLIGKLQGPFVLALDSPWGTGKTTLVKMLKATLEQQGFQCIYFNAWQVDYVTDPLVALVSSVDRLSLGTAEAESAFRSHLKTVKKITSAVAKRGAIAAAKAVTLGALDLEKDIEAVAAEVVGGLAGDAVDAFQKETEALAKFREELESAVFQLKKAGKKETLVFFLDELDRCRPTFAIEMLERIKHLFDVQNIVFVLSVDKSQLEASTAAVYGEKINAQEYLRRFIDIEYALPVIKGKAFTELLLKKFDLDGAFEKRSHPELRHDREQFVDFFSAVADVAGLSLRTRERCITRLQVVIEQTPHNNYLFAPLIALLIVLRVINKDLFSSLQKGIASAMDVMEYLKGLPGGGGFVASHEGVVLEIGLILSDGNGERKDEALSELNNQAQSEKLDQIIGRASELQGMIRYFRGPGQRGPSLSTLLNKIELASGFEN